MQKEKVIQVIHSIVVLLIAKKYEDIIAGGYKKGLSAEILKAIIEDYGGMVTLPPVNAFETMRIYTIEDGLEASVDFDLWIDHKQSDLTLMCDIINSNDIFNYSIVDIHVL